MNPEQTKQRIIAETASLMHLKVDNAEVIKHTFKSISEQVSALRQATNSQNETYQKAFDVVNSAMHEEYTLFDMAILHDEKEQALIQLRHKAAEVCELIQGIL